MSDKTEPFTLTRLKWRGLDKFSDVTFQTDNKGYLHIKGRDKYSVSRAVEYMETQGWKLVFTGWHSIEYPNKVVRIYMKTMTKDSLNETP